MEQSEIIEFFSLLDDCSDALGRPRKSAEAKKMYLVTLGKYGLKNLIGAVNAHMLDTDRGRFHPSPADLKFQIDAAIANDGRPSADEAFSIAVQLLDESASVISNNEISQAWAVACEIMPDRVGARMAFRQAYEKAVVEARSERKPVNWFPSLGTDKVGRESVVRNGVSIGLLPHSAIQTLLPPPENPEAVKMIGNAVNHVTEKTKTGLESIAELKRMLSDKTKQAQTS